MAKHPPIHKPRDLTLKVNDSLLERLKRLSESVAAGGTRGNTYEDVGLIALRLGLEVLEEADGEQTGSQRPDL